MTRPRLSILGRLAYRGLAEGLDRPTHPDVTVQRDVGVRMSDGVVLLTDVWAPASRGCGRVVLIRTPYGRRGNDFLALLFAERGHTVVVQSVRGTFGSGGTFTPFFNEAADGVDCLRWIAEQPWAGPVHTYGYSYFGFTQWALLDAAPGQVAGITVGVSARDPGTVVLPSGGFGHESMAAWLGVLRWQERGLPRLLWEQVRARTKLDRAAAVPLRHLDRAVSGARVDFFQDWLDHADPADPWWDPVRFARDPEHVPPATLVAGWHDLFVVDQVADFHELAAAGRPVSLVVGPWTHMDPGIGRECLRAALAQLAGEPRGDAVRVQVAGEESWRSYDAWPPPADERLFTISGTDLVRGAAAGAGPIEWSYDPLDPTPACGGRTLSPTSAGPADQVGRESRADVPYATSAVLTRDLVVIGEPVVEGTFTSTAPVADLFVRVCDVDPTGRSTGVTDGYTRVRGSGPVRVRLAPTGYRFKTGHRIRLQVSSGAHPWYARQTGTERIDDAEVTPSRQRLEAGATVALPVVEG